MDEPGTHQAPSNATSPPKADTRVTGKILDLLKSVIYNGFPVAAKFTAGVRASVAFAKTDVAARRGLEVTSNEATTEAGLFFNITGGAAQANRIVDLFMAENGVAFGGALRLNHFGGTVELGGTGGAANNQTVVLDTAGHLTLTQTNPPTGVLGTGAGTGAGTAPALTIAGADQSGTIQIVTGTQVPAAGAAIVTVTFKTAMTTAPRAIFVQYANGATQALTRAQDPVAVTPTTTTWVLFAGTTGLAISTTYLWYYWVV